MAVQVQRLMTLEGGEKQLIDPVFQSAGAADAGKVVALNEEGKVDETMLPDSRDTADILAVTENVSAGDFVNLYKDTTSGELAARLADNSNGRPAHGFVKQAATSGSTVGVYALGITNAYVSALEVGTRCYLGTAGKVIQIPLDETLPANKNYLSQYLGIAKSSTEVLTIQEDSVLL